MKQQDKADLKLNFDSHKSEWRMAKDDGMSKGPDDYPKLKVEKDHEGQFTFVIQNPKGIKFAATDPFAPKAGKANPGDFGDQFAVSGHGTDTLVVKDANANKDGGQYAGGDYHYELRFSEGAPLDPIITNGGCCNNIQGNLVYFGLGAVALLALIVLVVRPMMAKRSPMPPHDAMKDRDQS
jgi:hypothetical protein